MGVWVREASENLVPLYISANIDDSNFKFVIQLWFGQQLTKKQLLRPTLTGQLDNDYCLSAAEALQTATGCFMWRSYATWHQDSTLPRPRPRLSYEDSTQPRPRPRLSYEDSTLPGPRPRLSYEDSTLPRPRPRLSYEDSTQPRPRSRLSYGIVGFIIPLDTLHGHSGNILWIRLNQQCHSTERQW